MPVKAFVQNLFTTPSSRSRRHSLSEKTYPRPVPPTVYVTVPSTGVPPVPAVPRRPLHIASPEKQRSHTPAPTIQRPRSTPPTNRRPGRELPGWAPSHPPQEPSKPIRPALKTRRLTDDGTRPSTAHGHQLSASQQLERHVTFQNPRRTSSINMHPVLAAHRGVPAPIEYDVVFKPSVKNVFERDTPAPVHKDFLSAPATDPPIVYDLVLESDRLPRWSVIAKPHRSSHKVEVLTVMDVLKAVNETLSLPVSKHEWDTLGYGSLEQQKVTDAYHRRCAIKGGKKEKGVLRVDFLGSKTKLVGVEVDHHSGIGVPKLVFSSVRS